MIVNLLGRSGLESIDKLQHHIPLSFYGIETTALHSIYLVSYFLGGGGFLVKNSELA